MMTKANNFILTAIICFSTLFFYAPPTFAQCNTCPVGSAGGKGPAGDLDGDGVCNDKDVDDDNDGILDVVENPQANQVTNSSFTSKKGWVRGDGWGISADGEYASNTTSNIKSPGSNLSQKITLRKSPCTQTAHFKIRIRANNASYDRDNLNSAILRVYLGNVVLFRVNNKREKNQTEADIDNINSLIDRFEVQGDASRRYITLAAAPESGQWHKIDIYLNNATLPESGDVRINFISTDDDFRVDDITYRIGDCNDTDGDGVANHQDLDSDNDGILDVIEANPRRHNGTALSKGCRYPDGKNNVNGCEDGSTDYTVGTPERTGTDGVPDYLSLDSDEDGCPDATEANLAAEFNVNGSEFEVTEVDSDGLTDAGCDARPRDNQWIDGIPSQADGCRQKEEGGEIPLSVIFNKVGAFVRDGMLQVSWTTETEKQSDYFEVEVSKDGKNWSKAGTTIKTKATDPNRTGGYSYEQSIALTGMSIMGISLFLLSIGVMLHRSKWLGTVLVIVSLSATLYACSKEHNAGANQYENLYVRIKQTNIDGRVIYSDAVRTVIK